jgi:hypothetical protein
LRLSRSQREFEDDQTGIEAVIKQLTRPFQTKLDQMGGAGFALNICRFLNFIVRIIIDDGIGSRWPLTPHVT